VPTALMRLAWMPRPLPYGHRHWQCSVRDFTQAPAPRQCCTTHPWLVLVPPSTWRHPRHPLLRLLPTTPHLLPPLCSPTVEMATRLTLSAPTLAIAADRRQRPCPWTQSQSQAPRHRSAPLCHRRRRRHRSHYPRKRTWPAPLRRRKKRSAGAVVAVADDGVEHRRAVLPLPLHPLPQHRPPPRQPPQPHPHQLLALGQSTPTLTPVWTMRRRLTTGRARQRPRQRIGRRVPAPPTLRVLHQRRPLRLLGRRGALLWTTPQRRHAHVPSSLWCG